MRWVLIFSLLMNVGLGLIIGLGLNRPKVHTTEDPRKVKAQIYEETDPTPADVVVAGDSQVLNGPWADYFYPARTLNRGIGSETTGELLLRLREIARHKPKVLVVLSGINDLRLPGHVDEAARNLRKIAASGVAPRIIVVPPLPTSGFKDYVNPNRQALVAELKRGIPGATLIDLSEQFDAPSCTFDGLHINAKGYKVLWQNLAPVITTHLSDLKSTP